MTSVLLSQSNFYFRHIWQTKLVQTNKNMLLLRFLALVRVLFHLLQYEVTGISSLGKICSVSLTNCLRFPVSFPSVQFIQSVEIDHFS
jgi:hypothetical protein